MNEKNSLHKCKNCKNFRLIYEKCVYDFIKTTSGICSLRLEIVKKDGNCEFYKTCVEKVKTDTLAHIDVVIEDIKELERMFYNVDY